MKNLTATGCLPLDTTSVCLMTMEISRKATASKSREFITEFLKSMPEIRIHAERKDDGFSGVDFFLLGFRKS
ncbi:MAG: hypothetical protein V8R40_11410 [Dysosmobacter sp.]